ncbi:MAG TPA: isoamylase [Candidatus Hydrogenedentes bacterium]|nr:isoamylase [Candidatus Hydrogenedentota bacterium]HQM47518.1 isoamylase [Candidatus Hydrogenedentota bacterium]
MANVLDVGALKARPGRAIPLGASVGELGVHFAIVSRHATRVWLAIFGDKDDARPAIEFELDAERNRIGDVWSIFIENLHAGAYYLFRLDGPYAPKEGHRFDPGRYVLDPYARMVVGSVQNSEAKCVVVDVERDWEPYLRPRTRKTHTVIYETHIRGFTVHESAGVKNPGTYLGFIEKIPYLKELGITAVEFMPVQEVGEEYLKRRNPKTSERLKNYWGYAPIAFFAPAGRFGSEGGTGEQLREFRELVSALHEAGLEVILDVVFNHTAEGDEDGPTLCFRGIDHSIYYLLDEEGRCLNFTGCGNTMNCNHPFVRDLIRDCLRYWTTVVRVDGFRFDLASVLGRDQSGNIIENAPIIERIAEDPVLRDVKLTAEAWDVGGAYQVGSFGNDERWSELNGKFRDDVRRYWINEPDSKGAFALRITGSPDLYQDDGRLPIHSVNFVTSHDGFTLCDLFSYNKKHNELNGEKNRDGTDHNFSWNCGVEGETDEADILALRLQMQRNLIATLFTSLGVPMILGGDEFGRTQKGNNNAYCQDNEVSWYDWRLLEKNAGLFRFFKGIIQFRKENVAFERAEFYSGKPSKKGAGPDVRWFRPDGKAQDWNPSEPALGWWINATENEGTPLYLMFNPSPEDVVFDLPNGDWWMRVNTAAAPPGDLYSAEEAPRVEGSGKLRVAARSMAVLSG